MYGMFLTQLNPPVEKAEDQLVAIHKICNVPLIDNLFELIYLVKCHVLENFSQYNCAYLFFLHV